MTVTLNHTIVPAADNHEAARFFATIMGLECLPPAGAHGHFAPVKVNDRGRPTKAQGRIGQPAVESYVTAPR